MNHIKNIGSDLVEKRLWPVALALVLAAIAVPLLVARSSSSPSVSPVPTGAANPAAAAEQPIVAVEDVKPGKTFRPGSTRDPFRQRGGGSTAARAAASTSATTATATATATAPTSPSTSTGSTGSTTGSGPTTTSEGSSAPSTGTAGSEAGQADPTASYAVKLRFGRTGADLREHDDIARLSALPSPTAPSLVFLGTLKGGQRAVFLLRGVVETSGEGICKPNAEGCTSIEMEQGDHQRFTVQVDGAPVQYELEVVDIDPIPDHGAPSIALAAIERHSDAGADLLRDAHLRGDSSFSGMDRYRWMPAVGGTLVRILSTVLAKGPDSDTLPGEPVWHFRYDP